LNPLNNYASQDQGEQDNNSESDENVEKMFKIVLSEPKPEALKISSKNVCIVTILQESDGNKLLIREKALL
jgi:hypothetical protein